MQSWGFFAPYLGVRDDLEGVSRKEGEEVSQMLKLVHSLWLV